MKQLCEEFEGFKIYFLQYDIDDLVQDLEYLPEVSKAGLSKEQIKQVALEFYKTMCEDLIMDNNAFILPERGFGGISIKDIADINNKDYRFDFENEGRMYQPTIAGYDILKKTKRVYLVRFNGEMQKFFESEISKNHLY